MTYVVTQNCLMCKHTYCVDVCPVDSFRETPLMLVIDPEECIDCGVCVPECPVNAILPEENISKEHKVFISLNEELAKVSSPIVRSKPPLPSAAKWAHSSHKAIFSESEFMDLVPLEAQEVLRRCECALSVNKLTEEQWHEGLTDPHPAVRFLVASRPDFVLSPARLQAGLRDPDQNVRKLYIRLGGKNLPNTELENLLTDAPAHLEKEIVSSAVAQKLLPSQLNLMLQESDASVRLAILKNKEIYLSEQQIFATLEFADANELKALLVRLPEGGLQKLRSHKLAAVRAAAYELDADTIAPEQLDLGFSDKEKQVRLAVMKRSDFVPSVTQFIEAVDSGDEDEEQAILEKLRAEHIPIAITHRSSRVRRAAYADEQIQLSAAQVERGIHDPNIDVVRTLVDRKNFHPSLTQFISLTARKDPSISLALERKMNGDLLNEILSSNDLDVIQNLVRLAPPLSAEQRLALFAIGDPALDLALVDVSLERLSKPEIKVALRSKNQAVRLQVIQRCEIELLDPDQIENGLTDSCEDIRSAVVRAGRLTSEQLSRALKDTSEKVRFGAACRLDLQPSIREVEQGLKDSCDQVRKVYSLSFFVQKGKVIQVTPLRTILALLNRISGVPTWTKRKRELKAELEHLLDQSGYTQVSVDARSAWYPAFGDHGFIQVPEKQRGALQPLRGTTAHLVRLTRGRYSDVYFAAKDWSCINPVDFLLRS